MSENSYYPVQIQADNIDATYAEPSCLVHVFDISSEIQAFSALSKMFLHVVAYDAEETQINLYDNRRQ